VVVGQQQLAVVLTFEAHQEAIHSLLLLLHQSVVVQQEQKTQLYSMVLQVVLAVVLELTPVVAELVEQQQVGKAMQVVMDLLEQATQQEQVVVVQE
jgi:hypothetical protein